MEENKDRKIIRNKLGFFAVFSVGSIPYPLQTNIDKASNCNIERRKKKIEVRETAVITVLVDWEGGGWGSLIHSTKSMD